MQSSFFAMIFRMKYINRWSLMRNTKYESLSEHSMETAMIAQALAIIRNKRFDGNIDADRVAAIALFHDCSEIITGDLPTPVKYHNEQMRAEYKKVEVEAEQRLLNMLPLDLKEEYAKLLTPTPGDEELWKLVKAADKIAALIKCIEERSMNNNEFKKAELYTLEHIKNLDLPEADVFMKEFLPAFELTIDEQV